MSWTRCVLFGRVSLLSVQENSNAISRTKARLSAGTGSLPCLPNRTCSSQESSDERIPPIPAMASNARTTGSEPLRSQGPIRSMSLISLIFMDQNGSTVWHSLQMPSHEKTSATTCLRACPLTAAAEPLPWRSETDAQTFPSSIIPIVASSTVLKTVSSNSDITGSTSP